MNNDGAQDLTQPSGLASPLDMGGYQPFDPQAMAWQGYQSPYLSLGTQAQNLNQPEFLFPESEKKSRSLVERMSYSTGLSYLSGMFAGGVYGAVEGLRHPAATSNRLRVTTVLNAVGKRGPFLGNSLAVILIKARSEKDDSINEFSAAAATGTLYRLFSGPRAAVLGGLTGLGLMGVFYVARAFVNNEELPLIGKHEEKEYE
eukprot:gene10647-2761_t